MPVATIETKSVKVDDDLTDLSWLTQMNNNNHNHNSNNSKQQYTVSNEYNNSKIERKKKPFAIVNGQTIRPSIPTYSHDHQYFNDENQYYSHQPFNQQTVKRKYDSSISYQHHSAKRFHSEQMYPLYPTTSSSETYYYDHHSTAQQRTSRYMLFKNDPTLSDTIPNLHMSTNNLTESIQMIEHENIHSDDIEHLLDIFKNEVEMLGFDPIATTSTGDSTIDINHCLASNQFCSY